MGIKKKRRMHIILYNVSQPGKNITSFDNQESVLKALNQDEVKCTAIADCIEKTYFKGYRTEAGNVIGSLVSKGSNTNADPKPLCSVAKALEMGSDYMQRYANDPYKPEIKITVCNRDVPGSAYPVAINVKDYKKLNNGKSANNQDRLPIVHIEKFIEPGKEDVLCKAIEINDKESTKLYHQKTDPADIKLLPPEARPEDLSEIKFRAIKNHFSSISGLEKLQKSTLSIVLSGKGGKHEIVFKQGELHKARAVDLIAALKNISYDIDQYDKITMEAKYLNAITIFKHVDTNTQHIKELIAKTYESFRDINLNKCPQNRALLTSLTDHINKPDKPCNTDKNTEKPQTNDTTERKDESLDADQKSEPKNDRKSNDTKQRIQNGWRGIVKKHKTLQNNISRRLSAGSDKMQQSLSNAHHKGDNIKKQINDGWHNIGRRTKELKQRSIQSGKSFVERTKKQIKTSGRRK